MTKLKKFLCLLVVILLAITFFVSTTNNDLQYKEDTFTIEEGETLKTISQNLKKEGFIKNSHLFYFTLYFSNDPKNIKAGTYELSSSMSYSEIIDQIIKGSTVNEKITILEGWTIDNIADYFEEKGLFKKDEFFKVAGRSGLGYPSLDFSNEFKFLECKPKNMSLEGFLFPDTYYINEKDTPETIVKKMLSNFEKKVFNKIENKDDFYNTLILASIIEKEVRGLEDKRMIANILLKRLQSNVALRVDATVIYANTVESKNELLDLEVQSPYNTYEYPGLPIGPISNPGLESVEATLNPINNNYWYYLSAKDGTTIFSKNFEEHKLNKNIYLR